MGRIGFFFHGIIWWQSSRDSPYAARLRQPYQRD